MHRPKECVYRAEFDMETLVWTRGRGFPLSRLESRLRCPHCGSRDVQLIFTVPSNVQAARPSKLKRVLLDAANLLPEHDRCALPAARSPTSREQN
jgi:hypothetical protein